MLRSIVRDEKNGGNYARHGEERMVNVLDRNLWNNLDINCVLIGLQVCCHNPLNHENDVSKMVACLKVVRIYGFATEIIVYMRASYCIFLFVKTENINSTK